MKDASRNLIELWFQLCYQNDIIEHQSFLNWSADDDSEVDGKTTALLQTLTFFEFLKEVSDDEGDEDEDDDLDTPLPTVA